MAAQPVQDGSQDVVSVPRRYWWLKRIAVAVGIVLVVLVAMRWWWGRYAERQLQAEIDRYRAAGEPIYLTDFDPPPVADKDNAALAFREAAAALGALTQAQNHLIHDFYAQPDVLSQRGAEVRSILEATVEARAIVRRARSMSGTDWGIRLRSPGMGVLLPHLSPQRHLCKLLRISALYDHSAGNDAEAIETVQDLLVQARHLEKQPVLICHLVATAVGLLSAETLEDIVHDLRLVRGPYGTPGNIVPASRTQVDAVIRVLLDDAALSRGFVWAMCSERAILLDASQSIAEGRMNPFLQNAVMKTPGALGRGASFLFRPMIQLDTVRLMRYTTLWVKAAEQTDYPTYQALGISNPVPASGLGMITHVVSESFSASYGRAPLLQFRALAFRRMASAALAMRLYEVDCGRRPGTLDELVPQYLPFVPQDPFAVDGRKIGYNPKAERPVLYSIGPNGIDEQGQYRLRDKGDRVEVYWEAKDLPFFLNGDRPGARSSTTAAATAPAASSQAVDK